MIEIISKGVEPITGLEMKRQFLNFIPQWDKSSIYVTYKEWLETSTGVKVSETCKGYYCNDIPAIYYGQGEVALAEVLDEEGNITAPAILYDGTEIKTPAINKFTYWMQYPMTEAHIGKTLGFEIIVGAINYTLNLLPINVIDGYILGI